MCFEDEVRMTMRQRARWRHAAAHTPCCDTEALLTDQCSLSCCSKSEPPISYEDWCEEKKAKEEEEKKKKKEEEEQRKKERRASKKKAAASAKSDSSDDEDLGLKKEQVRGYKINSEGRKTSFFNNELTKEQKDLIGDITPKPIAATNCPPPAPISSDSTPTKSASAWNSAGTWEEKDTTEWCQGRLKDTLKCTVAEEDCSSLVAKVSELKDVNGGKVERGG